jgi:hypothetical protein
MMFFRKKSGHNYESSFNGINISRITTNKY